MMNNLEDQLKKQIEQVRIEASEENALLKANIKELEEHIDKLECSLDKTKKQPKQKIPCGISVSIINSIWSISLKMSSL